MDAAKIVGSSFKYACKVFPNDIGVDNEVRIDLHVHTTASDGELSPEETMKEAFRNGVEILSITDHDTLEGLEKFVPENIIFIPGVEISARFEKTLHILGYGFDIQNTVLRETLCDLQKKRSFRNKLMLDKARSIGLELSMEELQEMAGNDIIGRPHFARLMVKKGYVDSYEEAFEKYLGKGKALYIEKDRLTPEKAIELILDAGGIPVLAHPYQTGLEEEKLEEFLKTLKKYGLMGIEVFYPEHTNKMIEKYLELSKKYDLLVTGGSDFHGKSTALSSFGIDIPFRYIREFLKKLRIL